MNEDGNRKGYASCTNVDNKYTATIAKEKFIIQEEIDKLLSCKEKFLMYRCMRVRVSLQEKKYL